MSTSNVNDPVRRCGGLQDPVVVAMKKLLAALMLENEVTWEALRKSGTRAKWVATYGQQAETEIRVS